MISPEGKEKAVVKGGNQLHGKIDSILLIQLGDIGDVILTLPCLRGLREAFPNANIQVAVREKAAGLISDCPWASGVIIADKKKLSAGRMLRFQIGFIKRLRKQHFNLAIDLRTGTRGAILALLSGAGQRISFYAEDGKLWRNKVFTSLLRHNYQPDQYVADYLLDLLAAFNINPSERLPEYIVPVPRQSEALNLLQNEGVSFKQPILAFQPFSLWDYKELPKSTIVALLKEIIKNHPVEIILIGSPGERKKANAIVNLIGNNIHNLAGRTSISVLPAVLRRCSLFVGIDSAGLHLAAAVGVPTVGIFGPSSPQSWAPRGRSHKVIQADLDCLPCRQKGCNNSEISKCLQVLGYEFIYQKIKPVIASLTK